jgi:MFS family permease
VAWGTAGDAGAMSGGRRATSRLARSAAARVRRAAHADGADRSGLAALISVHSLHSAGDALVTVSLAGSLFFSVPLGEARGRVVLYLLLTLLPFSFLVPVAGPLLDRFRHGRRNVLAVTTGGRGLVAWAMAGWLSSLALYPAALAVLVLSRAYGVARSAAVARVRPERVTLVQANARLNVASVASASAAAVVGGVLLKVTGSGAWTLRLAALVLLAAAVAAIRLPDHVDEQRAASATAVPYRLRSAPAVVLRPLVAAVALRGLAGMLTVFLAFLLRERDVSVPTVAAVLSAAVVGQLLGTLAASRLPDRVVTRLTLSALVVPAAVCLVAAFDPSATSCAVAAGVTGLAASLAKFRLDAALQTHVPVASTSSAFARSETGLQLAWALGGAVGVAVPYAAPGFVLAALIPAAGLVVTARTRAVGRGPAGARRRLP